MNTKTYNDTTINPAKLYQEILDSNITIAPNPPIQDGSDAIISFKAEISTSEETTLDGLISSHDPSEENEEVQKVEISGKSDIQNATPVILYKSEKESFARATHDFTDKTTWYSKSVRVDGEQPSVSGLEYSLANTNIIDVVNKKINRQDTLQEYKVVVYEGGTEITEGFTINHTSGVITFSEEPAGAITVDYSYENGSEWIIEPDDGKILIIEHSEVQFATDVTMTVPLRFEIWAYNPLFDVGQTPVVEDPNYNPMTDAPRNQLRFQFQNVQYNSVKDLVNEANLGTGTIPAIDDLPECVVFPFNYASIKVLKSSEGAQIRVKALNDTELGGSFGTATFYCLTEGE